MKHLSFRHSLLALAALAAAPAAAFHPAPLRVPPGGPHPEDWFSHCSLEQREKLRRITSSRVTQAQELVALLLQGDEDAYYDLALNTSENREAVAAACAHANREQRKLLDPLRAYHKLAPVRSPLDSDTPEPRAHVVLYLRDTYHQRGKVARLDALHRILTQEPELNRLELDYIAAALLQWCGVTQDPFVERRIMQGIIRSFAGGKPVTLHSDPRSSHAFDHDKLYDFLVAEAGVNNARYFLFKTPAELMWRFLWRYPEQAVQLAEGLDMPVFSLLRMDSASLADLAGNMENAQLPPALPHAPADEPELSAYLLASVRSLLAEGKREEAARIVGRMKADPVLDTTPAGRMARSLLLAEEDPAAAARHRRDALLLALIRRDTEPEMLHAYVDDLLANGSADELALVQRVSLWCKALPDYAALAPRYEQLGAWREAAFCYEALLTLAPFRAETPADEALASYRARLESCRARAAAQPPTPPVARSAQPASPFRAESRDWKLKDGSTAQGQLTAIYPTLGEISLRLSDGSARSIPLDQLADNHDAYFGQWRADNGIRDWKWRNDVGCYQGDLHGKLLAAYADLEHPGDCHYTVVNENLTIARGQSWGLHPEARQLVQEHFRSHGSARPYGEPLVAATLEEARRLADAHGLPVMFFFTGHLQGTSYTNQAIAKLENRLQLHPEDAATWRRSMVILPIFLSTAKGYPATYDEGQLEELRAYEREVNPGTTRAQSPISTATRANSHGECWVCPEQGLLHHGELPPPLPEERAPHRSAGPQEL